VHDSASGAPIEHLSKAFSRHLSSNYQRIVLRELTELVPRRWHQMLREDSHDLNNIAIRNRG
jgi:hypothetical protein